MSIWKGKEEDYSHLGEKFWVIGANLIFAILSSLVLGVIIPLNFHKFEYVILQLTLGFIENTNRALGVGKIGLEFQIFYTGGFGWYTKTFLQLRDMKHIVYGRR